MSSKKSGSNPKQLAKAKVPDRNSKVTDFFARKTAQSPTPSFQLGPVALATRSRQSNSSKASSKSDKSSVLNNKQFITTTTTPISSLSRTSSSATLPSPPSTSSRPRSPRSTMMTLSSRTTRSRAYSSTTPNNTSAVARASQKRPRSPDQSLGASHLLTATSPANCRSSNKRKKKFDSDSETERPDTVIYVQKLGSHLKSSSLAPPPIGPQTPIASKHIICSSQSDEMDLVIPVSDTRSLVQVKEQVHTWRQNTLASPLSSVNDHSPNDAGTMAPLTNPEHVGGVPLCSSTPLTSASPQTPIQPLASLPSPPDTEGAPPLPVTPLPSDNACKTTQLVASIKARAFAESPLSDEEEHYTFRELDESSDDDLETITALPNKKDKGMSSHIAVPKDDLFDSPLSSISSSMHNLSTSYNLRNRNSYPSASPTRPAVNTRKASETKIHTRSGRTSKPAPPLNCSHVLAKDGAIPAKHKKSINPLEALLREKKAAEKRGNGSAALQRAEDALRARFSFDVDPECLGLADEVAAWQAIQECTQRKSSSPTLRPLDEVVSLGERETHILGSEAGSKIQQILVSDNHNKSKMPMKGEAGVPLWHVDACDDRMNVDGEYVVGFGKGNNHPVLALLQHLSGIGATDQLGLILSSGVLGVLGPEEKSTVVSSLFALATRPSYLADMARLALHSLWNATSSTSKSSLRFNDIATALVTLGARPEVAEGHHWPVRPDGRPLNITHNDRLRVVSGLVKLIEIAGRTENLVAEDMPDILLSLVLIGLDNTTSNELRASLNSALDSICKASDTQTHISIHRRLLSYASTLLPANKAHFVSFFSSGSGRTRHIAQWLAYALLLPDIMPSDELPPLDPLILLLSPTVGSGDLFDVTSASADFEDLGHYFAILSVALANIEPYVQQESSLSQPLSRQSSITDDSPRKTQKPLVPLELLLQVLEVSQGRIVDTRAAHLDRSRTKAAMHRLQMRVHYQRQALKAPGGRAIPTIQYYFGRK